MKRFHARVKVVSLLKELGLFVEVKDNPMQIPLCRWVMFCFFSVCDVDANPFFLSCSKSGDIIEPVLKPQWWVNCKPLAEEAIKVRHLQLPSSCLPSL